MSIRKREIGPTVTNITYYTRGIVPSRNSESFLVDFLRSKFDLKYFLENSPTLNKFETVSELKNHCQEINFTSEIWYFDRTNTGKKTTNNCLRFPRSVIICGFKDLDGNEDLKAEHLEDYISHIQDEYILDFLGMNQIYLSDPEFKLHKITINLEFILK